MSNEKDSLGKKVARKAISTALGYLLKYYPIEKILMMVSGQIEHLVNGLNEQSAKRIANYNNPTEITTEDGESSETLLPAPEVKAMRFLNVLYTHTDENGKPSVTVAGAYALEDGTIIPDPSGKVTFSDAATLLSNQIDKVIGPDRENLNVKLSHLLLPAGKEELKQDEEEERIEEKLISEGPPKEIDTK